MKNIVLFGVLLFICMFSMNSQNASEEYAFYIRAVDANFEAEFSESKGELKYTGNDRALKGILAKSAVTVFRKEFPNCGEPNLAKTFYGKSGNPELVNELLAGASHIFEYGDYIGDSEIDLVVSSGSYVPVFPDDYGPTGPAGSNNGVGAILDQHDYIGSPDAWKRTKGLPSIHIGMSDGGLLVDDAEFVNKTTLVGPNSPNDTDHGTGVSALAAAQGDNSYGVVGVGWNNGIMRAGTGYNNIVALAEAGAKVINCSWVAAKGCNSNNYIPTQQDCINYATSLGAIVVAGSGNDGWACVNQSEDGQPIIKYPASYDNVISVATVGHRWDTPAEGAQLNENGLWQTISVKDHVGFGVLFEGNNPVNENVWLYPWWTHTLNEQVDILGTGAGSFSYGRYLVNGTMEYPSGTSASAPHVSGTVGLMLSLNECLSFNEVESILKLTSRNIDHVEVNQLYKGYYGSGALQTGSAVEMVYAMMTPGEVVHVRDQVFNRWDFILESAPERIEVENQTFSGGATAHFKAKESIELLEGTLLEPSPLISTSGGESPFVLLEIDTTISTCSQPPLRFSNLDNTEEEEKEEPSFTVSIVPNPSTGIFNIVLDRELKSFSYKLIDFTGNVIFSGSEKNMDTFTVNRNGLKKGMYFISVTSNEEVVTSKVIIN